MTDATTLVIGVGNRDRGDDAAGPAVCDRLDALAPTTVRTIVLETSPIDLATHWRADDLVVIVDAARPTGRPGRISEHDALADRYRVPGSSSTHGIDVAGGVELARVMDRLPAALTIVAIEGGSFEFGAPLTDAVERSVARVAARVARQSGSAVPRARTH